MFGDSYCYFVALGDALGRATHYVKRLPLIVDGVPDVGMVAFLEGAYVLIDADIGGAPRRCASKLVAQPTASFKLAPLACNMPPYCDSTQRA